MPNRLMRVIEFAAIRFALRPSLTKWLVGILCQSATDVKNGYYYQVFVPLPFPSHPSPSRHNAQLFACHKMAMDKEANDKQRDRIARGAQTPPNQSSGAWSNEADVPLTSVRVDSGPTDVSVDNQL